MHVDCVVLIACLPLDRKPAMRSTLVALCCSMQYGEDQEVKTQELGDMYDPEGDE